VRLQPFLALSAACALLGCGGGQSATGGAAGPGSRDRGQLLRAGLDDRPALIQNQRLGDPHAAVAFAVARDASPSAAAAVPALLRARLAARGFPGVRSRAHAIGYSLEVAIASAAEGRKFVAALTQALTEPIRSGEPALEAARVAVQALGERRFAGAGDAALAACSGELGANGAQAAWDPRTPAAVAELNAGLSAAHSRKAAAFAVVGPPEVIRGVADALADGETWPSGDAAEDPWPARDELHVDFAAPADGARRLSVALRLGNVDGAVAGAQALGAAQSPLARRLAALDPPWRVERTAAVARPRGACLRVDAIPPEGDPGPTAAEVARAYAVISDELRIGLAPARGAFDEAVLRPTDPAEAASAAAWRALVGHEPAGTTRQLGAYLTKVAERGRLDLAAAVTAQREAQARPLVDLVSRSEQGQARVVALLASTCGTAPEAAGDAGESALVVTALAHAASHAQNGVLFEPWIAADGVGILATAAPNNAGEPPLAQATRLAAALGELLIAPRTDGDAIVQAREILLAQVGRENRRGYALALDTLTQGHPSWLEPRGVPDSIENTPEGGIVPALHRFLGRPLRLAVLTNTGTGQADAVRAELERWLRPVRIAPTRCPTSPAWVPKTGETTLKTVLETREGSYYALPFPGFAGRLPSEAAATLLLLNRQGGWLDQALTDLPAAASARALGGPHAGAIVVQVSATDGQEAAAVARIRGLFDRLATTAVSSNELAHAQRELARTEASERLDPRRRAIDLWRNAAPRPPLDAQRLLRFHQALRQSGALLVTVLPKQ
jgi:hypothetical protein